jgi:hypothetical protein
MANGVVVQFGVFSALAAILICLLVVYKKRKNQREPSHLVPRDRAVIGGESQNLQTTSIAAAAAVRPPQEQPQVRRTVTTEAASGELSSAADLSSIPATSKPPVVVHAQPLTIQEEHNQRILAGISENIRKSHQIRPVPTYSPIPYSETPRNTEYVRVKKEIITPHGQIRFSILKDSISTNMLAVFRRASLDWKTPDDLIGFLPSYLKPEAEILNDQLLLIGTPGHNEKLAVPIRSVDADSSFRDCFDFVTDVRTATNTPAVLLPSDTEFELVSRGVITTVFMNPVERGQVEVKLLVEKSPEALQQS